MIIAVGHLKGGVGKTTIAMNLAIDLQRRGYATAVIDADPTLGTAQLWGDDRSRDGLRPLPVGTEGRNVLRALNEAHADYQDVILDLPAGGSSQMDSGLMLADVLVVPTTGQQVDLESLESLALRLTDAQRLNTDLTVLVVLNRVGRKTRPDEFWQAEEHVRHFPGFQLAETVLVEDESWNRARAASRGVVEFDCEAGSSMQKLTREIFVAAATSSQSSAGTLRQKFSYSR